ncbi:hypothetical protein ACP4OV_008644 [Aristida adscensionis]
MERPPRAWLKPSTSAAAAAAAAHLGCGGCGCGGGGVCLLVVGGGGCSLGGGGGGICSSLLPTFAVRWSHGLVAGTVPLRFIGSASTRSTPPCARLRLLHHLRTAAGLRPLLPWHDACPF